MSGSQEIGQGGLIRIANTLYYWCSGLPKNYIFLNIMWVFAYFSATGIFHDVFSEFFLITLNPFKQKSN